MGTGGTSDATALPSGGTGYSARIDRGRFSDIIVARQRSTGLVCALKVVKLSGDPWPSYRENAANFKTNWTTSALCSFIWFTSFAAYLLC